MAMEITNNYRSYVAQGMAGNSAAGSTKKKETEKTQETAENSKSKKTAEYANELAKLVPSVDFKVGNVCSSAKSGRSLTVNPQLLEKMQKDPKTESLTKASGWTIVYQHSYIDKNGKYHCRMQTRNDGTLKLSDKLRAKRRNNLSE